MIDTEPAPKTAESLYREAAVLLRKLTEQMPGVALPDEPWTFDDAGKPVLSEIFTDMEFLLATDDDPIADRLYAELYKLYVEAEKLPTESIPNESERLRSAVSELIELFDEETIVYLHNERTYQETISDERRLLIRDTTFRELHAKMTELVQATEIREPESRNNPEYDWFWKDMLPQFLKIRSALGNTLEDGSKGLTHDMPNWTPLLDYCGVASNEL